MTQSAIYKWDGGYTPMKPYDGQPMEIVRPCRVPEEADAEVGPMFIARFQDGSEQAVYSDEIVQAGGA